MLRVHAALHTSAPAVTEVRHQHQELAYATSTPGSCSHCATHCFPYRYHPRSKQLVNSVCCLGSTGAFCMVEQRCTCKRHTCILTVRPLCPACSPSCMLACTCCPAQASTTRCHGASRSGMSGRSLQLMTAPCTTCLNWARQMQQHGPSRQDIQHSSSSSSRTTVAARAVSWQLAPHGVERAISGRGVPSRISKI